MIVLASRSPRRSDLLTLAGFTFELASADIDESVLAHETPDIYTLRVSKEKALAVRQSLDKSVIIISADTTVAYHQMILGKPNDTTEAQAMLTQLRGHIHQVYTAITVLDTHTEYLFQDLAVTDVRMRPYSDAEITAYLATGDPMDKAGSYAIQNTQFHPVAGIVGCYANVVGLPLCHLVRILRQLRITPTVDVPSVCQKAHEIDCPVYAEILA